ncbi:MAG: hypothetical protein ACXV7J_02480 [Methylomonas sp.]
MINLADSIKAPERCIDSIKKTATCLVLALLLGACSTPSIQSSGLKPDRLQALLIVPVQSPPLEVIPDLLEQRDAAYRHYQNMSLGFPLQTKLYQTAGGITVAGLVNEAQRTDAIMMDERSSLAGMLAEVKPGWTPTHAVALKAQDLLAAENIKGVLSRGVYRLPLTDSSHNADLHRWHDAIQAWYGQEQTAVEYGRLGDFDAVLEIGIGHYRIFEGQTSLQVLIKLIDPVTRRVIARAKADDFRVDDAALASVDRGGEPFKQLIANLSVPLLRQGLGNIGLHGASQWFD